MIDYGAVYAHVNEVGRRLGTGKVKCTRVLAKQGMVVRLDELTMEELQDAGAVEQLVVFADVVEVSGTRVNFPGMFVTIVCRILVLLHDSLRLDLTLHSSWSTVFNNPARFSLFAQKIVSAAEPARKSVVLQIRRPREDVALNSTAASDQATAWGSIIFVVQIVPDAINGRLETGVLASLGVLLDPNIIMGIQSTLLIAELILSYRTDLPETVQAAVEHAQWISSTLLAVEASLDSSAEEALELRNLLARAQMLLKFPTDGSQSLIVPRLEYRGYQSLIDRMVMVAESYNSELGQFMLFITQTQILQNELLARTKAFAAKERDVADLQSSIVSRKRTELLQAEQTMTRLNDILNQQAKDMEQAQNDMEQGLKEYKDREVARAFIGVLVAVVEIGVSFATGGLTALSGIRRSINAAKGLARLAEMIKAVIKVMEQLAEAMEVLNAVRALIDAVAVSKEIFEAPEMPDMPTIAEWDIFENEIELVAEGMPEEVSEARVWRVKCKNVAAVCREITRMGVYISQLQYELFVQAQQEAIATRHAERLEQIEAVNLDNYMEMATQIDMRTTRLLLGLLKMMSIQNAALQYHYLLPKEPFTGWPTIDIVRRRLIEKEIQAVHGLEALGMSTNFTRTFNVEDISVDLLLSGEDWNFTISPESNSPFPLTFSRVRIRHVEMKFANTGLAPRPSTTSGKLYILLQGSRTFQDRRTHQVLQYDAAVPIAYPYAYNLSTGETTLSNEPSQDDASNLLFFRMTPFTNWRLRLSSSAFENEGLLFPEGSTTTSMEITFHITAIRSIDTRLEVS